MPNAYQLNNLTFRYGHATALSIADQAISAHKITALIGPNGCGKSTLLNLLAFLQLPSDGELSFFNEIVSADKLPLFRQRVAYLPQKPYLFKGTVEDNLKLPLKFHHVPKKQQSQRIHKALQTLDISHLRKQHSTTLSGGELQKAALARAILTEPDVLLMDEPFSYLDYESVQRLEALISGYVGEFGNTVLFSTHDRLHGMAIADQVLSLMEGRTINTALINVFHGHLQNQLFDTGKIAVHLPTPEAYCKRIYIDPNEIVLSAAALKSSMRNQFSGRVSAIAEEKNNIRVTVTAGEVFQAVISHESMKELDLKPGSQIWINFNANAVTAI